MKLIKKISLIFIAFVALIGCTANFEEINTNPNSITVGQIQAYSMFEPILYNAANDWVYNTWFWNDELIQFTAFTGGTTRQEHRYFISDGNWQSMWNMYAEYANNSVHMYKLAKIQDDESLQAVALTMKVLFMANLTDMFGDIPYSQAFTATELGGTTTPVFDSQQKVYEEMFADLDSANNIYARKPTFVNTALDGMYSGNMTAWQKFNNSLYLRLLCRISGRNTMQTGVKMSEIINNPEKYPIFTSNADNATVHFSGIDPYLNEFYNYKENDLTSSGRKLTQQLIKMTVETDKNGNQVYVDPRLPIIGKINPNKGIWKGTVSGGLQENQNIDDAGTSWLNAAIFCRTTAPVWFMDYAEIEFILAEAAEKGFISGGETAAKLYYENAVTASLQKWSDLGQYNTTPTNISDTDISTYLASNFASWDKTANKEELIGNQKYLALFWIGMEAYHEYRRTGYPQLTIGAGTVYNDYILPTRFAYPTVTMATNGNNAKIALQRMGGNNDMKTPVWWSKQAINEGK